MAQSVASIGLPDGPAIEALVDEAAALLRGRRIAVLTGAGLSTDSGIPDYRGAGAPVRTPMTFTQFLSDPDYRKRYWAGKPARLAPFRCGGAQCRASGSGDT